ncbi:MAG: DUF4435 domain-containing protein [Bacteroidales bacterium]|nr:DUF4435 domain-containing protein [Bacteroidales bacterium]
MAHDHIREQAEYFANIPLIDRRIRASVHLEAEADVLFWDTMFQRYRPGQYHYIYHSRSRSGGNTSGVCQCLLYRPYLSKRFLICIDSDLRSFYSGAYNIRHFILQTYCYSWENHYCWSEGLQARMASVFPRAASEFDFRDFLRDLSHLLYRPFVRMLYAGNAPKATMQQMGQCLSMQQKKSSLYKGARAYLQRIRRNLSTLPGAGDYIPQEWFDKAARRGLTPDNVYLHFRGHNIYDQVCHLGLVLCNCSHSQFEQDVLLRSCPRAEYKEQKKIQKDMEAF